MAYAQTNYSQRQGIAPTKYTIAQIGCFITSFANILQRFGIPAGSPLDINNLLVSRNLYIDVDDGYRDDVGWTTVIALYPKEIRLEATGYGAPSSNNSIVKFNYKSRVTGAFTTHFCLVQDAKAGTIIDSWDGAVKHWSAYGGPVAYATYSKLPSAIAPTPQGGANMFANDQEIIEAYAVAGRVPSAAEIASWRGGSKQRFFQLIVKETNDQRKQLADVRAALANERAKPPKEVIKTIEKIVDRPIEVIKVVEKPVEVIKEVEKPLTWQRVVDFVKEQLSKLRRK